MQCAIADLQTKSCRDISNSRADRPKKTALIYHLRQPLSLSRPRQVDDQKPRLIRLLENCRSRIFDLCADILCLLSPPLDHAPFSCCLWWCRPRTRARHPVLGKLLVFVRAINPLALYKEWNPHARSSSTTILRPSPSRRWSRPSGVRLCSYFLALEHPWRRVALWTLYRQSFLFSSKPATEDGRRPFDVHTTSSRSRWHRRINNGCRELAGAEHHSIINDENDRSVR